MPFSHQHRSAGLQHRVWVIKPAASSAVALFAATMLCLLAMLFSSSAFADEDASHDEKQAASYEAPLPVELSTSPDLCAHAPCKDVFPEADRFSERKGRPSYVEAYHDEHGTQQLLGYVFLSTDIVDIPAYSGKPVVTLIGMDA
ncbi:MAG: hypothetical protein Q8J65_06935, partial [Nitrosomonadales bacterium]|nr:hypothetical protein [Nitrosomonadales bacterium]